MYHNERRKPTIRPEFPGEPALALIESLWKSMPPLSRYSINCGSFPLSETRLGEVLTSLPPRPQPGIYCCTSLFTSGFMEQRSNACPEQALALWEFYQSWRLFVKDAMVSQEELQCCPSWALALPTHPSHQFLGLEAETLGPGRKEVEVFLPSPSMGK